MQIVSHDDAVYLPVRTTVGIDYESLGGQIAGWLPSVRADWDATGRTYGTWLRWVDTSTGETCTWRRVDGSTASW